MHVKTHAFSVPAWQNHSCFDCQGKNELFYIQKKIPIQSRNCMLETAETACVNASLLSLERFAGFVYEM
jgi:hypothetical protein